MSYDENDRRGEPRAGTSGPPIKLIVFLVLAVLLAIFFFQNMQDAPVDFLWMDGMWPMSIVIAVSVLVGGALTKLAGFMWNRARARSRD